MSHELERIRDRIRKLLAVADNDASFEGEIDNALRFARRLMMEHHLTREDVIEEDGHTEAALEDLRFARVESFTGHVNFSFWESQLAHFVERFVKSVSYYYQSRVTEKSALGTIVFNANGKPKQSALLTWYGPEQDAAFASSLFNELATTIMAMARMKYGSVFRGSGRSYSEGFVEGLESHLETVSHEAPTKSETRELIALSNAIAVRKREMAERWLKDQGIRIRGVSHGSVVSHDAAAWHTGRADGASQTIQAKGGHVPRIASKPHIAHKPR